jgi:hypothetical protein
MIIENEQHIQDIHHNMEALEKDYCVIDRVGYTNTAYWRLYDKNENRVLHINADLHPEFSKFFDFE